MSRFFGLSLHPLENFELESSESLTRLHKNAGSPEPSLITFALSTSQYGLSCLDPVIKHEKKIHGLWVQVELLYVAHARVSFS